MTDDLNAPGEPPQQQPDDSTDEAGATEIMRLWPDPEPGTDGDAVSDAPELDFETADTEASPEAPSSTDELPVPPIDDVFDDVPETPSPEAGVSEPEDEPDAPVVAESDADAAESDAAEPVVAESDEPAVAESDEPVVAESDEPVVAESDEPVVAESDAAEPVVADSDEPVVAESDEPAVAESDAAESDAAEPIVAESDEPVVAESDVPEPAAAPPEETGFAALGLRPELLTVLDDLGYEEPTPIQRETIPLLLTGADMLGQAATGTGKTAAFALPALQAIEPGFPEEPSVLVLVPTRELAVQVSEAMFQYGRKLGAKVVPVFGGQPIGRQLGALDRGAHIVVATPGRAIDHIGRGSLRLGSIKTVILDEADEMLDMGFTDDIESILESTPDDRQTVLFSATMPSRINAIARRYQRDPIRIKIGKSETQASQKLTRQSVYFVRRADKPHALGRILDIETPQSALVFCRTRMEVDQLTATMNLRGYRAEALHGGMDQAQRDRVMGRLRDGTAELLVATDVAARGLDVDTLTHVVNYDVPAAAESYVHRIGRVGRAGREGTAITIADPRERRLLNNIERLTKQTIEVMKVPTVADLRARQVELTVTAVRESLASVDLEDYNGVLHSLAGEDSDRNIALAAIKLVHLSRGAVLDEREIPDASVRTERSKDFKDGKGKGKDRHRDRPERGELDRKGGKGGKGNRAKGGDGDTGFLFVSQGRKAGVRPGDLVGAIANESGLVGRDIGPIRISDNYAVVGVPKGEVENVINAMKGTTMRGKPVKVRPYND